MAFDITKYQVDFSTLADRDQAGQAVDWSLDQIRTKANYLAILGAFVDEVNELYVALAEVAKIRTIAESEGVWLEGIGRIVGQAKENIPTDGPNVFFMFDSDEFVLDNSLQWITDVPDSGDYDVPTDADYQLQIIRRIYQNMNRYSSIPEIKAAVLDILGIDVRIEQLGARNIKLWVPTGTPAFIKYFLTAKTFDTTTGGYNRWYFPFPAGVDIDATIGEY